MKKIFFLSLLFCFLLVLYSCSASDTATYNAGNNENWKIHVIHETSVTDRFKVLINDSTVIDKKVNVITGKLEEIGKYREKDIKLVVYYDKGEYGFGGGFKALVYVANNLAAKFDF